MTTVQHLRRVHPRWIAKRERWIDIQAVRCCQVDKKRYLPKGVHEFDRDYQQRLNLTRWVPEAPSARNRLLGSVFSGLPDLTALPDGIQAWAAHVDRRRRTFLDWTQSRLAPILADFGSCPVLIERPPKPQDREPQSLAEQQELGILNPLLRAYSPLEVRNWATDDTGKLLWVLTVEDSWRQAGPLEARTPSKVYRLYERQTWKEWTTVPDEEGKGFGGEPGWNDNGEPKDYATGPGEKIADTREGEHGLDVVPFVVFVLDEESDFLGQSLISNSVELDLRRLVLGSDQDWDLFTHAHPVLKIKTKSALEDIGLGSGAIKLDPARDEPEDAEYLQLPGEAFAARAEALAQVTRDIYRHVGVDPQGVLTGDQASSEASGVSRAWSFKTSEGRHIGQFRDRLEEGQNQIIVLAAKLLGVELEDERPLTWPSESDDTPLAETLENATSAKAHIRSPSGRKLLQKRVTFAALPDLTQEQKAKIEGEIESQPDDLDEHRSFEFGGPPTDGRPPDPNARNGAPQPASAET